ncbi:BH0509 family protein [Listeria sp. FSL L7-1699]|uniref:BH0509 family protein n=1 Tax=Listeria farberi TaxID=2713500 RepID=A0ABR6SPZ0_9LIST|nr:BH0509 family protein [Listeria farberi]MBC1380145.1 BH0509 family protein [Listeria farberi]MBC2266376.1 BH0509 family protein [Listeria farberi]
MEKGQQVDDTWVLVEIVSLITNVERQRLRELSYADLEEFYERVIVKQKRNPTFCENNETVRK